jgi:hypothetical protein
MLTFTSHYHLAHVTSHTHTKPRTSHSTPYTSQTLLLTTHP